jgi:hypothetical protein
MILVSTVCTHGLASFKKDVQITLEKLGVQGFGKL